jgi:ribose 5-phosphate isomerase A
MLYCWQPLDFVSLSIFFLGVQDGCNDQQKGSRFMSGDEIKKRVCRYAADLVKQGMIIGIGSGSTVYWLIEELGKRVREGLEMIAVPTSMQTAQLAAKAGISISDLNNIDKLALTIDGADEIGPHGQLIKGGGGALLQEKIVAAASEELVIIADSSKLVQHLGKFPLPVEVIPFGHKYVEQKIIATGSCKKISLRMEDSDVFVTDHGHYILDCDCEKIADASALNTSLHLIPGVVETGLFINMANKAIIGYDDGNLEIIDFKV